MIHASALSKQNHVVRNDKTMVFIPAVSKDISSILWLLCFVRPRKSVTFFFPHAVTFCRHTYHLFDNDLGCYVDLLYNFGNFILITGANTWLQNDVLLKLFFFCVYQQKRNRFQKLLFHFLFTYICCKIIS